MRTGGGESADLKALATEASVLRRLAGSFVGGMDMEKVCRAIADAGVEETKAESCSLYMTAGDGEKLSLAAGSLHCHGVGGLDADIGVEPDVFLENGAAGAVGDLSPARVGDVDTERDGVVGCWRLGGESGGRQKEARTEKQRQHVRATPH